MIDAFCKKERNRFVSKNIYASHINKAVREMMIKIEVMQKDKL